MKASLARAPWIGMVALFAGISGTSWLEPSARRGGASLAEVADLLGHATRSTVLPEDVVWEPSHGALIDATLGRGVVFLGAIAAEDASGAGGRGEPGMRDVFRACVRVSAEGRAARVLAVENLTETPLADEGPLTTRGFTLAVLSRRGDEATGATVLAFGGPVGRADNASSAARRMFEVAACRADSATLVRTVVALGAGWVDARLSLKDGRLEIASRSHSLAVELEPTRLVHTPSAGHNAAAWRLASQRSWTELFGDVVRVRSSSIRAVAVSRVAAVFRVARDACVDALAGSRCAPNIGAAAPSDYGRGTDAEVSVPRVWPGALATACRKSLPGEGQWRALGETESPRPAAMFETSPRPAAMFETSPRPAAMFETSLRPDADRAHESVRLVALDTRQLELRYVPGYDSPHALTGPGGSGMLPASEQARVVASFTGARVAIPNAGVLDEDRVLAPPIAARTTIALDRSGRTWLGAWPYGTRTPEHFRSIRQGFVPLLAAGASPLPSLASDLLASDLLAPRSNALEERAALCRTKRGQLVFAWSHRAVEATLTRALGLADCDAAVRLDAADGISFALAPAHDGSERGGLLDARMSGRAHSILEGSREERFFLLAKTGAPRTQAPSSWSPVGEGAPDPLSLPALHRVVRERHGEPITLWSFTSGRYAWEIRPGTRESAGRTTGGARDGSEQQRALVAIGLGTSRLENRRGLVKDGAVLWPIRADLGVVSASPREGALTLEVAAEHHVPRGDQTELVLLVADGKVRREARELGAPRVRMAACLMRDDTLLVAEGYLDNSEPLALELVGAGCTRVVSLDRGDDAPGFLHRAGSETPPRTEYYDTALFGLPAEPGGVARDFSAERAR
ncbi:MAG: hypothetical protein EXR75_00350 [Myxococcales bacterium]|nr:hypothetical protein [Myxococcales bacterium]